MRVSTHTSVNEADGVLRAAILSDCGIYRFLLARSVRPVGGYFLKPTVCFVLNNPSTADAIRDDQTVRKCWAYTRYWGYEHMVFANTNPFRSTDPELACMPPEDVLEENDKVLKRCGASAELIICAWGTKASPELAARALGILWAQKSLYVLELSKDGIPKHPLYLKGYLPPTLWRERIISGAGR
jgi:hypothetical protein